MSGDDRKDQLRAGEYDGIQEYDNRLPNWWLGTFFLTIIFGFAYWMYFYTFPYGDKQSDEYHAALEAFNKTFQSSESEVELTNDYIYGLMKKAPALSDGKKRI